MKKKLSLKDELQALSAGIGIVGGLFLFVVFLCAGVGGYDPQTMFDGLLEDFKMLFS